MQDIKINEQIAFLRKQKNITQEELAQALGVTNQSVSKWESGVCCPDIQLLPQLASFFGVSVDELLGYKPSDTFNNVYLKIKALFQEASKEEVFTLAFRLASLLHEGAATSGYKKNVPWNTDKNYRSSEECCKWGFSACSEPEGVTIHQANSVFITDNKILEPAKPFEIRAIYSFLTSLCNKDTLKVLFGLYEITISDFDLFVSADHIANYCKLSEDTVLAAIETLPVQIKESEDGQDLYRIEGCYMHIPPILLLLRNK